MDNFLSGREQIGNEQQPQKEPQNAPEGAMKSLQLQEDLSCSQLEEAEGESGSRVSYVTEEGRVTKIVVTCACGQVTEIDCKYEL